MSLVFTQKLYFIYRLFAFKIIGLNCVILTIHIEMLVGILVVNLSG